MEKVTRFSVSINYILLKKFDSMIKKKGYKKRSDAVSDLMRHYIKHTDKKELFATMKISYNRKENKSIPIIEQEYPCLILSSMRVNIDNNNIIETMILKGTLNRVNNFYKRLKNSRGIKECTLEFKK